MKSTAILSIGVASVATAAVLTTSLWGEGQRLSAVKQTPPNRFIPRGRAAPEGPAQFFSFSTPDNPITRLAPAETDFDDLTNGYFQLVPDFDTLTKDNVDQLRSYYADRFLVEEKELS